MALKHITLHVTRQETDGSGRRRVVGLKVAETDVPELTNGSATRSVPLLLTHALSIGGEKVTERMGFDYTFREPVEGNPELGGFVLGEESGFPYVFGIATEDPDVWGFVLE